MSDAEIISHEPATGAEIWRGRPGDLEETIALARRAFAQWAAQSLANRIELMRRFANEVRKDNDMLARLIARETGKPLWEALAEVEAVVARVELAVRSHAERCAQRKLNNALQGQVTVRHKPHGIVVVLSAFSQPALTPASHMLSALIAGNCVILKPSESTHATAEALIACIHRAGVPAAVAQMLVGDAGRGIELALHKGIDAVLFSGTSQTGLALHRRIAAQPGKLIALELGGNNPLIVLDTPKLDDAATVIVQSAFTGAGQRSTAARRLIVKATMADAIIDAVKRTADRIICGAPFDEPAPFMGPVINTQTADGLTESFIDLLSHGGKAIKHLAALRPGLPFLSPAIIDVTAVHDRPDVELFGPILQVIRVETLDEAIAEANATRFGLAAGLVGGGPKEYEKFWTRIRAGLISWNRPMTAELPAAPFGGIGISGNHRPGGFYTADNCAYPVTAAELEQPRAVLGAGFKP